MTDDQRQRHPPDRAPTRDVPLVPGRSALLVVDVQNYCCHPHGGMFAGRTAAQCEAAFGPYLRELRERTVPNLSRLVERCRRTGLEILYTVIESLTEDGRDRSLDYKISGIHVPRGSWDARVIDALTPHTDDIVIPKTASSVFNATNADYVLRNLGVAQLAICGVVTEQCVESAVRDACDLGYLVTLVTDACASLSEARHRRSLDAIGGYCRQVTTATLLDELAAAAAPGA